MVIDFRPHRYRGGSGWLSRGIVAVYVGGIAPVLVLAPPDITVTGRYKPTIAVTGRYLTRLTVTGRYLPTIDTRRR